jgi:hypothetical protein
LEHGEESLFDFAGDVAVGLDEPAGQVMPKPPGVRDIGDVRCDEPGLVAVPQPMLRQAGLDWIGGYRGVLENGAVLPGLYVAGWVKRGPIGVIGNNRADAVETVRSLLADAESLPGAESPDPAAVVSLLEARGVRYVTRDHWLLLDTHELTHGASRAVHVPRSPTAPRCSPSATQIHEPVLDRAGRFRSGTAQASR